SRKQDRGVRVLGLVAAFAVIFQGVLGGITVLYRLPTLVSTAHLAVALAFFSLLIYLCFRLRPEPAEVCVDEGVRRGARWALGLGAVAVYLQILLGALVRHTGSGHACPVLPLCGADGAQFWPVLGAERLHMVHRGGGFVVFFVVLLAAVYVLRRVREGRMVRRMTFLAPALLLLQILVGAWTVLTHIAWVPAMLHLGVAAAILASLLVALLGLVPAPADQTTGRRPHASGTSPLLTLQEGETT
ncbi:MAG: COX15/CtaA family protein, partial [Myxococcota bacterium]|nr:COX15/CtaA family protein [Myxococcota bacterium]